MAPLETIWLNEMHSPPTATAYAAMLLTGSRPLTSGVAMIHAGLARYATLTKRAAMDLTLDDLSDMAQRAGLEVDIVFTPNVRANLDPTA